MSNRTNPELDRARKLAAALRSAKSTHPWTTVECGLLANLCAELGVDAAEHSALVTAGEAMAEEALRLLGTSPGRSKKGTLPEGG